eukprot:11204785-Lingulodinium_polyedra.AAC.1
MAPANGLPHLGGRQGQGHGGMDRRVGRGRSTGRRGPRVAARRRAGGRRGGWPIAGAALDWRKAFDHVPLIAVGAGLERAGVPEWLRGPVCSAYAAPRRIRVDGALGDPWQPTNGILPGRALAVFVLRVMLAPWERAVDAASTVSRRIYFDDLTFWKAGLDGGVGRDVSDALAVTRRFEAAVDWQLNAAKSRLWANTAGLRRWLAAEGGG